MKDLKETSIVSLLSTELKLKNFKVEPKDAELPYTITIRAIAEFLGLKKNKKQPVAFVVRNVKDEVLFIAKISCHIPEDENEAPNWSFEMAFNPEDIDLTGVKEINSTDISFYEILNRTGINMHSVSFESLLCAHTVVEAVFKTLKKWLDDNASADGEVSVGIDGYFVASVGLENGEKVFSIVPDGAIKTIIKDDSALVK